MVEPIELAKGLVAGFAIDLVRDKSRALMRAALVIALIAVVIAVVASGAVAWIAGAIAVLGLVVAFVAIVGRFVLTRAVSLVADPTSDPQQRVHAALEEADLPTGPVSVARLLVRLGRDGAGDEIDRLRAVVTRLADDL